MKRTRMTKSMLAVALTIALPMTTSAVQAEPVERAAWLAGCWRGADGERTFEEQWMTPRAGLMLGMGRTSTKARVASYEQMRIEIDGEALVFTSKPSGKPEASFRALPGGTDAIVFENLDHPFPQRVMYRLAGESLQARIEGQRGDRIAGVDFPMQRVACSGAP